MKNKVWLIVFLLAMFFACTRENIESQAIEYYRHKGNLFKFDKNNKLCAQYLIGPHDDTLHKILYSDNEIIEEEGGLFYPIIIDQSFDSLTNLINLKVDFEYVIRKGYNSNLLIMERDSIGNYLINRSVMDRDYRGSTVCDAEVVNNSNIVFGISYINKESGEKEIIHVLDKEVLISSN